MSYVNPRYPYGEAGGSPTREAAPGPSLLAIAAFAAGFAGLLAVAVAQPATVYAAPGCWCDGGEP